ncbi:hypothetical protein GCM10022228_16930 [Halomonas cibimaris]|uniref:Uncharacterized protein n=1 Tax=Halomonas cibimaris TaxID=657012 RepID=A0ABP7LRP6_9GAMM
MKTILIMEGHKNIHGHNLDNLYEKVSLKTQKEIEKKYISLGGNEKQDCLYLKARLSNSSATEEKKLPVRGVKISQVMKNNRDIFITFRYMFERGRTNKWEGFYFEFGNLNIIATSIDIIARGALNEEQRTLAGRL